ncbi:MAG: class I tRNA ligase family protein [Candidatus Adlerbacteria bacterium]|nr:class I tRNA ligase family protein [Candidatus Adlerbacteria bacterium]
MSAYDHKKIEKKWQKRWEDSQAFEATEDTQKEKNYLLIEFPYPSGDGLHVGHVRSWTALDVVARKRRAEGKNVLYPIGWDAFGLPTENFALKTGKDPRLVTKENTDNFRRQIKSLGLSFDWSREINTTDPAYYKWTQWIFLQMYKKGLAYKAKTQVNWCPKDKIVLANEEVVDGCCERCGTLVEKREKEQWILAITKYAQRLYDDLDTVDYIERAKVQQKNWIGPSEGAEIEFSIFGFTKSKIKVFTTRPDTIFGATYMVLSPEHKLVKELAEKSSNKDEILRYIEVSKKKSEIERTTEGKEKTGVEIKGVKATNPASKEEIPIFIADYVLVSYGTGAIMAVPAHDGRDREFAERFNLPVKEIELEDPKKITKKVGGTWLTNYKLRDWIFSRQRYWGEPIPMVFCEKDGWVPVSEDQLPVELPKVEKYQPTDTGESPLANITEWVNTTCPKCDGPAKRETDVMPNWAGSSWYYLRYCDPQNSKEFASPEKLKYWTPVDWYNGGMEHTVLHLLYSRFWHKFLYDEGLVPTSEPYMKRTSHGNILAPDGQKMSKSRGNVINPDSVVETFGADSLRLYEMFAGPFDQSVMWNPETIAGVRRFLERVWRLAEKVGNVAASEETEVLVNQTIEKVSSDIENLKMNTAVSSLMILLNKFEEERQVSKEAFKIFLQLLAPFAPHLAAELAETHDISLGSWPQADKTKLLSATVSIAVQVNGKVRATVELPTNTSEQEALSAARNNEKVQKWLALGKEIKAVYVPGKVINFVVR